MYFQFIYIDRLGKEELQSSTLEMSAFVKAYMECTHFVVKEISDPSVLSIVLNDQVGYKFMCLI